MSESPRTNLTNSLRADVALSHDASSVLPAASDGLPSGRTNSGDARARDHASDATKLTTSATAGERTPISVAPRGRWFNKENRAPERLTWNKRKKKHEMSNRYAWAEMPKQLLTDEQIAVEVLEHANTISLATYRDDWVSEKNFIAAWGVGIDKDHGPDLQTSALIPLAELAFLQYATPSSTAEAPRNRDLFIFDEPIPDLNEARCLTKRLLYHNSQHTPAGSVDTSCKDAARRFHGSAGAEHILRVGARLPLAVLRALPPHPDELPKPSPERKPIAITGSRAEKHGKATLEGAIADYYANPSSAGTRHATYLNLAMRLIGMEKGSWQGFGEVRTKLAEAGEHFASLTGRGEDEYKDILDYADDNTTPYAQTVSAKPKRSVRRRLEKEAVKADNTDNQTITVDHVSDNLTPDEIALHNTLLVEGGTGLGKSTAIAAYVNGLKGDPYITALAQFRLLTAALYRLLKDFSHYEQADGAHQRALGQMARLVTSLSSLAKFDRHGGRVIIDEITGVLKFLAKSGTFEGGAALTAYRSLTALIESAVQLVGMDANLDDITIRFIEKYRGNVTVKRYRRAMPRGKVTLLANKIAAIRTLEKLLSHRRGLVFAPCSSAETTTQIAGYFALRGYRVLKITKDTSSTEKVRQITQDAALRAQYDLIAYDSACGAGVDFSEQAYAQVGIFDNMPLAPEDAIQLFGRVRHAERRYAAVPPASEGYPTPSASDLLADVLKREEWTARRLKSTPQTAGDMLNLAQLWADFTARHKRETARWRYYFGQRLQADGFTVVEIDARAPKDYAEAYKQWQQDRADQQFAFVLNAEGRALSDEDIDRRRMAGTEITDDMHLCNVRWQIETAKSSELVTDQDRDLMKFGGRKRLFNLRDWFSAADELHGADQQQRDELRPLHKRHYNALTREALIALFKLMGHEGTPEQQLMGFIDTFRTPISRADVDARYEALASSEAMRLFKALGHYGNNAETVTGLCRWVMDYFGLKLVSERRRVDGARTMLYSMDVETLDYRIGRARHAARMRGATVHKCIFFPQYTKVDTLPHSHNNDAIGWAAYPEQFQRQFVEALTAPIGAYP